MNEPTQTPIGLVPQDWVYKEIGPYIDMTTGPAFDSSRFGDDPVGTRLARGINITKGEFRWHSDITKYWSKVSPDIEKYLLQVNDVIIGMDGSLVGRNFALVKTEDVPSLLVQRVARLRTDERLDCRYLYYWIASDFWLSYVDVVKTHSGIPHISNGDIREFRIGFAPPLEQRKISRILTTLDNLIEKTENLIAKYQAVKQGMMHDLFTRGVDAHGKLRPPLSEAPDLYKQSDLGWIPKEWALSSVAEEFHLSTGFTLGTHRRPKKNIKPYLRVANVQRDEIRLDDVALLEATNEEFESRKLEVNDLLVVEGHADPNQIGRCAIITAESAGLTFQNHLFRLRCRTLQPRFACDWLNSEIARKYWLCRCATSSGLNTINQTLLKKMPILVPQPHEQGQIVAYSCTQNCNLKNSESSLFKFRQIKTGLMQDLLTGKVRVKVDEEEAVHV